MRSLIHRYHKGFIVFLAATLLAAPACYGQIAAGGDPAGFEIAGVKLGMTADEAIAALKGFDPAYKVTKKYFNYQVLSYGQDGSPLETFSGDAKSTAYLNDLTASKGAPKEICQPPPSYACTYSHEDDEESVTVWFSRTPGQEHVIAVQRSLAFFKEPKPTIASLTSGVLAKYPEPQPTFTFNNGTTTGWLFNSRRQLLSRAVAKNKGVAEGGGLPPFVRAGDGIGLNFFYVPNNGNAQLAETFNLALYDGNGLYRSIGQSKTAFESLKAQANARQPGRSAPTKF